MALQTHSFGVRDMVPEAPALYIAFVDEHQVSSRA